MAPLNPNNTARAYLTYSVCGQEHTMTVRYDSSAVTMPDLITSIDDFITAMSPLLFNSLFVRFETSAQGSNVRVPADWTGQTEWGGSAGDPDEAPLFFSFTGKDTGGRRFRLEIFGRGSASGAPWRVFAADDSSIAAALAALETEEAVFLSIAGNGPTYNQYANRSVSQHWIGELR